MNYAIARAVKRPALNGRWDHGVWADVPVLEIAHFLPESTAHRPETRARLLYDDDTVYGIFHVRDRYVRCVHTEFQSCVCHDSCVEFFFRPEGAAGYFNFEFNCGGTMLCYYIVDPTRNGNGFADYQALTEADARAVRIFHSLPTIVEPERSENTIWTLEFAIPRAVLALYCGESLRFLAGQRWRGNLYKCGDQTSHPHWASWAPLTEKNFHRPDCFGSLLLA